MKKIKALWMKSSALAFALAMVFMLSAGGSAFAIYPYWTNAAEDNNFANPLNWNDTDDNQLSVLPVDRMINLSGDDRAVLGDDVGGNILLVGYGENQVGELEIQSGEILVHRNGQTHIGRYSGSTGTVNQYGGTVTSSTDSSGLRLGRDHGSGIYNLHGGLLSFTHAARPGITVGHSGIGSSEFNVYGGAVDTSGAFLTVGVGAPGRFMVSGSNATSIAAGPYSQGGSGTLRFEFDDSDGVTPIEVVGDVSFDSGALLEVDWVDAQVFGTWTVMTWSGDISGENNLAFAGGIDTDIWSFDFNTGNSGSLTVTAIPEPSSLVLLGIAGLLLMKRRRV